MGIFSKFKKIKAVEDILALDIGTEVVKTLACKMNHEVKQGVVLGVGKVRQKMGNMQSGAVSDISGVIETARQSIEIARQKSNMKKVNKAIIGIAGELVKGTTTTVHYERVNPEIKIDAAELKEIIQKVQEKAYERIREQLAWETGQNEIEVKLINASIVDVQIDGYKVTNPINFQGHDVSISVFNAYAPLIHLGALETIANELKVDLLSIATEPYAVSRSVSMGEEVMDFSAIFIDVGGGTTDIAVVRNSGLKGTKIFALGGRVFTKRLAQILGIDFEEAEVLKIKYSEGKLSKNVAVKIDQILEEDCKIWLSGVELSLSEFADTNVLPSNILLCGGGSALPGIKKSLASPEWVSDLPFTKSPDISFIQPRDITKIVDKTGELTNPQDVTPMALANLSLDLANEEALLAGMLRRAMQTVDD